MKLFSINPRDVSTETRYELLGKMPVRVLLRIAKHHQLESTAQTVAFDLAQRPDLLNLLKFSIDFKLI